jgi:hypothetical protein
MDKLTKYRKFIKNICQEYSRIKPENKENLLSITNTIYPRGLSHLEMTLAFSHEIYFLAVVRVCV